MKNSTSVTSVVVDTHLHDRRVMNLVLETEKWGTDVFHRTEFEVAATRLTRAGFRNQLVSYLILHPSSLRRSQEISVVTACLDHGSPTLASFLAGSSSGFVATLATDKSHLQTGACAGVLASVLTGTLGEG